MKENEIHIVCDKFLLKEQRGKTNKPEWMTRMQDYMHEVVEVIKTYVPQSEAEDGAATILDSMLTEQKVSQILGIDVRLRVLLEINKMKEPKCVKLTLVVNHGKDFKENLKFVQTSMYK